MSRSPFISIGPDSDQKHLFSHTNSNSCDMFKSVAAQAVARDEGVLSEKSGLHTAPFVLQTASAGPEAVCFELRHFCRRQSVKTDPNAVWLVSPDVRSTYSEDGAVLLDIRKGRCYSLNPVATRVWNTLEATDRPVCGSRPPVRGVDMLRNTFCDSVGTELSHAPAAWAYDLKETVSETTTSVLDFSANCTCIPPRGCESRRETPPQRASRLHLFCHCPRLLPFRTQGIADGRLPREGICLLMTDAPEIG